MYIFRMASRQQAAKKRNFTTGTNVRVDIIVTNIGVRNSMADG